MLKVFNTITGYYVKKTCLSWWKLFYPKHCLELHVSLLGIHLNHLVLSFQSLMKSYDATIQIYFSSAVFSHGTISFPAFCKMRFEHFDMFHLNLFWVCKS